MVAVVVLLDMLPPPSTNEVNRLYYQLGEILALVTAQQVDCTHRHRVRDSNSGPVRSRADRQNDTTEPSVARTAPSLAWV
jgi:hypothetical protein